MEPMNEEEVRLRPWRIVTREVFGDRSMRELQEVRETLDVMISEMGADTYQDTITMNATRVDPTVASTSANASNATAHDQQSPDVGTTPATEDDSNDDVAQRHQCTKCSKTFRTKNTLGQHRREAHVGLKCLWPLNASSVCGFKATSEAGLKEHFYDVHIGYDHTANQENTWDCTWPSCGKVFSRLEQVKRCVHKHQVKAKEARDMEDQ